jgi:AraC-like DNA-binding protein
VKEIADIAHACGYEHPSQMTMDDIELSMGDNNRTTTLSKAYGYHKTSLPFENFNKLFECPYLGGKDARNRLSS